jgi:hypothetical protein
MVLNEKEKQSRGKTVSLNLMLYPPSLSPSLPSLSLILSLPQPFSPNLEGAVFKIGFSHGKKSQPYVTPMVCEILE